MSSNQHIIRLVGGQQHYELPPQEVIHIPVQNPQVLVQQLTV